MIDRREVVAGLAAVAVASAMPIMPVCATQTPTQFLHSFLSAQLNGSDRSIELISSWHYGDLPLGEIMIRHLDTGLTFILPHSEDNEKVLSNMPSGDGSFASALIEYFETRMVPLSDSLTSDCSYDLAVSLIHRAAAFVAVNAYLVLLCRPQHEGAVFLRFRPDVDPDKAYDNPITGDAPPLPSV